MNHRRVVESAVEVAIDANPVHLAAVGDLLFSDDRNVVLRLASDRAGVAADAGREVDDHAPGVSFIRMRGEHRGALDLDMLVLAHEVRVLAVVLERRLADEVAPLHGSVKLRRHQLVRRAGGRELGASAPRRIGGTQHVRVEADAFAHTTRRAPTVAEGHLDGTFGRAGDDPHRPAERPFTGGEHDDVAVVQAALLRERRAHVDRVVPREARNRLRQLVKPGVVREAAVEEIRVRPNDDLDRVRVAGRRDGVPEARVPIRAQVDGAQRRSRSRDETVVKRLPPKRLEIPTRARLPVITHDVVRLRRRVAEEHRHDLVGRLAAIERIDQRLNECRRTVFRARIRPRLQRVCGRDVPGTELRGLVDVETQDAPTSRLGRSPPKILRPGASCRPDCRRR